MITQEQTTGTDDGHPTPDQQGHPVGGAVTLANPLHQGRPTRAEGDAFRLLLDQGDQGDPPLPAPQTVQPAASPAPPAAAPPGCIPPPGRDMQGGHQLRTAVRKCTNLAGWFIGTSLWQKYIGILDANGNVKMG